MLNLLEFGFQFAAVGKQKSVFSTYNDRNVDEKRNDGARVG